MGRERNTLGWLLAGGLVLGGIVAAVLRVQPSQSLMAQFEAEAVRSEHLEQLRLALANAGEAEKSAVLAVTDEESSTYANRARAETAAAERHRAALETALAGAGTAKERDALVAFTAAFAELRRLDEKLLDLAVRNSNLKATAMTFSAYADGIGVVDRALTHLIAEQAQSTSAGAKGAIMLAAGAQASALRVQALLPPHIAEQDDAKMDALEARMHEEDTQLEKDLQGLAKLVGADNADLATARTSLASLAELRRQILALSRENTNVRSLSMSLNEKRKLTVRCEEALAALARAIDETRQRARATPHAR